MSSGQLQELRAWHGSPQMEDTKVSGILGKGSSPHPPFTVFFLPTSATINAMSSQPPSSRPPFLCALQTTNPFTQSGWPLIAPDQALPASVIISFFLLGLCLKSSIPSLNLSLRGLVQVQQHPLDLKTVTVSCLNPIFSSVTYCGQIPLLAQSSNNSNPGSAASQICLHTKASVSSSVKRGWK